MTRFLITSLLNILLVSLIGQTNNYQDKNRLKIGLVFSPDYNYRFLTTDLNDKERIEIINSYESPKMGLTSGVSLLYKIHKNINLETGFLFSTYGYKIDEYYNTVIDTVTGQILGDERISFNSTYYYFDFPLKSNFYIINKKLKWFFSIGVSINIFLSRKFKTVNLDTDETQISRSNDGPSRINIAALIGTGFEYSILDKWNIRIEPIYRQSITPLYSDKDYKRFMYSIGVNLGAYYKL